MKSCPLKSKNLATVSQYLLALLFLFSGITKAINPFGLSNQFGEYFNALGLDFLQGTQLVWSIALPAFEIGLGLFLIFGIWRKLVAWAVLLMMVGFTILTLWIAITNPVNDCGCFGEVLKISNWATFYKNIVFLAFAVVFFMSRDFESPKFGNFYTVTLAITAFVIPFYFMWTLPPFESTAYKVGNNLEQLLQSSGEIVTLPVLSDSGEDIHDQFVNDSTKTLFIVSPKLESVNIEGLKSLIKSAKEQGVKIVLLTAAPLEDASEETRKLGIEAYNSDYTVLKTMVQNFQGGVMYVVDGVVVDKWSMSRLPDKI